MQNRLIHPNDVLAALALLTRLPLRADFSRGAAAAWAWPLAGLIVGLIASCAVWINASPAVTGLLILAAQIVITGALHEDGLADTADGLWGGFDKARRLDIMKDSAIGTYGVLALLITTGLRWALITQLLSSDLPAVWIIAPAMLSRAPMAVLAATLPNARGSGLSQSVGAPPQNAAWLAVGIAILGAWITLGFIPLGAILAVSLTAIAVAAIAKRKIGGQTGDILGACQQLCEIAALLFLLT